MFENKKSQMQMNGPSRNDPNHNQLIREIKWGETAKNEKNQNSVKPVVLPISKKNAGE